jgi:DNA polymerase III, gamma/tau subunits
MSSYPTPSDIQRWYPEKWSEIAGNRDMVNLWRDFILHGPCNTLFTGPTRSGKTRTISLGLCALACTNRTETLDPCGSCAACRVTDQGRTNHVFLHSQGVNSEYSFHPIDCETVTPDDLENLYLDSKLYSNKTLIHLDEIAALRRRNLEGRLLKMVDESHAVWIASAISLKATTGRRKGQWVERLSKEMRARFPIKVGTSHPHPDDLPLWIEDRCRAWNISIADKEHTIPAMINKTECRVGFITHLFAAAASRSDRTISPELVSNFKFDVVD